MTSHNPIYDNLLGLKPTPTHPDSALSSMVVFVAAFDAAYVRKPCRPGGRLLALRNAFETILATNANAAATANDPNGRWRTMQGVSRKAFLDLSENHPKALPSLLRALKTKGLPLRMRSSQLRVLADALTAIERGREPHKALGIIGGQGRRPSATPTNSFNAAVHAELAIRLGQPEKVATERAARLYFIHRRKVQAARAENKGLLRALGTADLIRWDLTYL